MAQICDSHHPCCGPMVEIVRWLRRQTAQRLVVKLPEGVQIAMAAWRLAPLACRQLPDAPPPCVSVDALLALRDVLDHSLLLPTPSPATSWASQRQGVRDAQEPSQPPTASGGAALGPSHRLAAAPRATTPAVPRPHCPTAHGQGARRTARGAEPCVSRFVRRLGPAPLTSLSASPATLPSGTIPRVNGATRPWRTVPAPWALGRSSSLMRTWAAVAQGGQSARALDSSWPPCVRGVSGAAWRWKRHAWRGPTGTGII
jgi:hypothetical protein